MEECAYNQYILMEYDDRGVNTIRMRAYCPLEAIKWVLKNKKPPFRIICVSKDLTIQKFGFKMISRECIGATYLLEKL